MWWWESHWCVKNGIAMQHWNGFNFEINVHILVTISERQRNKCLKRYKFLKKARLTDQHLEELHVERLAVYEDKGLIFYSYSFSNDWNLCSHFMFTVCFNIWSRSFSGLFIHCKELKLLKDTWWPRFYILGGFIHYFSPFIHYF